MSLQPSMISPRYSATPGQVVFQTPAFTWADVAGIDDIPVASALVNAGASPACVSAIVQAGLADWAVIRYTLAEPDPAGAVRAFVGSSGAPPGTV